MKAKLLNVRKHLEHINVLIECYQKYGACPAFEHELKIISLYNRAILNKAAKQREQGNRKDLRVES
jgi:hypothetical protein